MSTTYRAAYYESPKGSGLVLTSPAQSGLNDDELRAEALAEAQRGDIIDMEAHRNNVWKCSL